MVLDLLARFIIGGTAILVASEQLGVRDCRPARVFFLSSAWLVLRYSLICAAGALCLVVLVEN